MDITLKYWSAVLVIAAVGFLYRASFLGGLASFQMPPILKKALEYVPVSVMAALVGSGFFLDGQKNFTLEPAALAAFAAAGLLAWKFKRDLLTIAAGLLAFWAAGLF